MSDRESPFDVGRRQGQAGGGKSPYPAGSIQQMRWQSGWRQGAAEREAAEVLEHATVYGECGNLTLDPSPCGEGSKDESGEPVAVDWLQQSLFVEVDA